MKIELVKETKWDAIWYLTYVDGRLDQCYQDENDADKRFSDLIENAKKPPVLKVLKEAEV